MIFLLVYGYDEIENSTIKLKNGDGNWLYEKQIFKDKEEFLKRWRTIEFNTSQKLLEIQSDIDSITDRISQIDNMNLDETLNEYDISYLQNKENGFEIFLIENRYISEDYRDYINRFVEGDLSRVDFEFIMAVRNKKKLPYDYKLKHINKVVERLTVSDFKKIEIFNFDLINYLSHNDDNDEKIGKIIAQIDRNDELIEFIDSYIKIYGENDEFIKEVVIRSTNIWKKIFKRKDETRYVDAWSKIFLLNKESLKNTDENFREYICSHKSFDENIKIDEIDEIISSLKELGVSFRNLEKISNDKFIDKVYEENMYELNSNMVGIMFELKGISDGKIKDDELSEIFQNEQLIDMKNYVLNNFEEYYKKSYSLIDVHYNNKETILKILNDDEIYTEVKEEILKREEFNKFDMEDIKSHSIQNTVIEYNKMNPTYKNILYVYLRDGTIEDEIIDVIDRNISEYCKQNLDEYGESYGNEIIEKFKLQYVFNVKVKLESFRKFLLKENITIKELKEIDDEKINYLIEKNFIEFNKVNYEFIKNNHPNMLYNFVTNNKTDFIENMENFDIEPLKNQILVSREWENSQKEKIIENVEIEKLNNTTLLYLIKNGLITKNNKTINMSVLSDELISYDEKILALKIVIGANRLNRDECIEYVHLLGEEYVGIGCGKRPAKLEINEKNTNICNILYKYNIIGKFRPSKSNPENEYIVYNLK